jgi:hypothetical protein
MQQVTRDEFTSHLSLLWAKSKIANPKPKFYRWSDRQTGENQNYLDVEMAGSLDCFCTSVLCAEVF